MPSYKRSVMRVLKIGLAVGIFLLVSCQSVQKGNYARLIDSASQATKKYSGFHQAFEATVTPLNREVQMAVLEKRAEVLRWTPAQLESALREANEKRLTHSYFFLRFFTPDPDYNDLNKPDSIWKVYLILGGQQYEAQIKKDFSKLVELKSIYPYFDRFSTGYDLEFPVGQAALADNEYQIIVTSSLGKAEFTFK